MSYITKSAKAIGQVVGFVMGAGFTTHAETAQRTLPYVTSY
jgi:hypothetical protein